MRILFLEFRLPYVLKNSDYPAGGYAVELYNWLKGLSAIDCHCGVLVWKGAREYIGRAFPFDLIDTYPLKGGVRIAKYFYNHIPVLLSRAKTFQPDVIVQAVPGVQTGMLAFIAQRLGVPFVYRVASDIDADDRYKQSLPLYAQLAYRYGLRHAAAILCQNQYQFERFKILYPGKQLHIIHNPFVPFSRKLERVAKSERTYIAWLANFRHDKNLPLLRDIARSLPGHTFAVGGMPTTPSDPATEEALAELRQLPNVQFKGYIKRQEVSGFLANALMLLNTSRWEGLSNTFLEAFSVGTPVVCPARVDPDSIIASNNIGCTSESDDRLTEAITQLASLPDEEYGEMASRCQEYVQNAHDPVVLAQHFRAILSEAIENSSHEHDQQ